MHPNRKLLGEMFYALVQLRRDLPLLSQKTLIFYPDFNYIHPYLYRQTEARYRLTDAFGSCLISLNDQISKPDNVHICLSLPTTIELLFSLQKHYNFFARHLTNDDLSRSVYQSLQDLRKGVITIREIRSAEIKNFLLTNNKLSELDQRLTLFKKQIHENKIEMLTDYYGPSAINALLVRKGAVLSQIAENMRVDRERDDPRSDIDKLVSYKVDSQNALLAMLNEQDGGRSINFVCSNRFYKWADPEPILQEHQRTIIFLITLVANLGLLPANMPMEERVRQIEGLVDNQIREGEELLRYCDSHDTITLDMDRKISAYIHANLGVYLSMAKEKAKDASASIELGGPDISYKDYLEIVDGRRSVVAQSMRDVHELIDDTTDDMYRDFVDDERIRQALSSLKLG